MTTQHTPELKTTIKTSHFHYREVPIVSVLRALASQEGNDGEAGNVMQAASDLIEGLQKALAARTRDPLFDELVEALRKIAKDAPLEEPERISGTGNEDDVRDYAFTCQHYWDAQIARAVLAKVGGGK